MEFLILFLVYALVFGFFCAYLAGEKGRSGGAWFFLGLIFGILALLVLIGLPSEQRSSMGTFRSEDVDLRLCPHCIQEVHERATACPHCQRDLPELEHCSYAACRKIINPTDDRCEDDEGNPYCGGLHRQGNVSDASNSARMESQPFAENPEVDEHRGWWIGLIIVFVGLMVFIIVAVLGGQ